MKENVREERTPMFMKMMEAAKEKSIEKVIVTSTKRIVGTPEVIRALEESGVEIEAMGGSHREDANLVAEFLASASRED